MFAVNRMHLPKIGYGAFANHFVEFATPEAVAEPLRGSGMGGVEEPGAFASLNTKAEFRQSFSNLRVNGGVGHGRSGRLLRVGTTAAGHVAARVEHVRQRRRRGTDHR